MADKYKAPTKNTPTKTCAVCGTVYPIPDKKYYCEHQWAIKHIDGIYSRHKIEMECELEKKLKALAFQCAGEIAIYIEKAKGIATCNPDDSERGE